MLKNKTHVSSKSKFNNGKKRAIAICWTAWGKNFRKKSRTDLVLLKIRCSSQALILLLQTLCLLKCVIAVSSLKWLIQTKCVRVVLSQSLTFPTMRRGHYHKLARKSDRALVLKSRMNALKITSYTQWLCKRMTSRCRRKNLTRSHKWCVFQSSTRSATIYITRVRRRRWHVRRK